MSCIYVTLSPLYFFSKVLGLAPYPRGKTGTAIPDVTKNSRSLFSTLHNYIVFVYMLAWFIFDMTWQSIYIYPKLSSRKVIPIVIRHSTFTGACLVALILCHRGSLRKFCSKIALVNKVLLGKSSQSRYKKTRLLLIIGVLMLFISSCLIALPDIIGRRMDLISIMRMSGFIFGGAIFTVTIAQYFVYIWILKSRFSNINSHLSALIVCENEKEHLDTFVFILPRQNKVDSADAVFYANGDQSIKKADSLVPSLKKMRNVLFQHDRRYIRALRQTHGILCDVIQMINSDFGLQILLIISYAFISFVMFTFLAMDAEHGVSVADCNEEQSCVRVLLNFCFSCTCIIKVMSIAVTCHVASAEASRTSTVVQKLLSQAPVSSDTNAELQLFSQQLWNIDTKFTAFGFFELNLNLLCSVAGTATTYIVVLLQLK
jgi:hypothetical protein